jgi:hypothetical protein
MKPSDIDYAGLTNAELQEIIKLSNQELHRRKEPTKELNLGWYTEKFLANALGLFLARNSNPAYDATDSIGVRYQIKARRKTSSTPIPQTNSIRSFQFDFLLFALFDEDFSLEAVYKIPVMVVEEFARFRKSKNAWALQFSGRLLKHPQVMMLNVSEGTQNPHAAQ